jgi:outer membrane protein assembly factor BamA
MRRWSLLLLAGLCWPAIPAQAAQSVEGFIGQNVVDVQMVVDGRPLRDAGAREMVETRLGEPLSMRQVRETLAHLFSLGLYRGVEVGASASRGGVALLYALQSLETIDEVEFEGVRGVSDEELRRLIIQRHGATFLAGEAGAVADTVRGAYAERGFFRPRVLHEVTGAGSGRVLRLSISTGPRAFVRHWSITGESSAFHDAIRARLGLDDRQPYDGPALLRRLGDYEAELRQRGYYEARLTHAVERLSDTEVDVHLTVRRGPRIAVTFEGDDVPDANPADLVPVAREASADEDLLEDADQRIASHLQGLGYRDAAVTHTRQGDADRLSIVFRVTRGPLYRVGELTVRGNRAVTDDTIRSITGVGAGDPLVVREIDAGLVAIEEHYSRLGFATVLAARSFSSVNVPGPDEVVEQAVEITIEEGVRTIVGGVELDGGPPDRAGALRQRLDTRSGAAYFGPQVERDRNALLEDLLNNGYEQARVEVDARFADDLSTVDLVFRIAEGRQVLVDHVLIVGNRQVDAATIRGEVTLAPGDPLGLDDVAETRRRLNALGMFRRIDIREFSHGRFDRRDVIIEVEEAAATSIAYGGGFEVSQRLRREVRAAGSQAVERIEFAPRGSFEIGRRNLWGRNRSIDLFTRVSVRRKNDPLPPVQAATGGALGFNEYRALATYREPRAIGRDWDVLVSGFVEQAIRPGFDLFSRGVTAQVTRSSGVATGTAVGYRLGNNDTSNRELNREDENIVDRLFPNVRLSSFTASQVRDTRDDPVNPSIGSLVTFESEVAARKIGSEVGFSKSFVSGSVYRRAPGVPRIVMAAGARLGVAWGFPRTLDVVATPAQGTMPASGSLALPISERFFAGGNTTVRGFALDRLGSPRTRTGGTIDQDGFPQGGNAMVILNSELRIRVTPALGVVTFLDAGNVYDRVEHVSLGRIRGGAGFGVRYNSPVGPLGFDIGFKLGERHFFGDETNRQQEQLWALHFSFGQAF